MRFLKVFIVGAIAAAAQGAVILKFSPDVDEKVGDIDLENVVVEADNKSEYYDVKSVIDGDTFKIVYEGRETSVRLIGVNTPETVDPRTEVECFGEEASDYLKGLLTGKRVRLETDGSQSDVDKYGRLLRYVYLDGEDVGLKIISDGYGYEYTYDVPYTKQKEYKTAQKIADDQGRGLWADGVCAKKETSAEKENVKGANKIESIGNDNTRSEVEDCKIKGNISNSGEKIFHVPGQRYYDSTKIDVSKGERWFCTEADAYAAGWRKSKV